MKLAPFAAERFDALGCNPLLKTDRCHWSVGVLLGFFAVWTLKPSDRAHRRPPLQSPYNTDHTHCV